MRRTLLIACLLFAGYSLQAQLKHYMSLNKVYYSNYFNEEGGVFEKIFSMPLSLSYKIEKDRWGIEASFISTDVAYNTFMKIGDNKKGQLLFLQEELLALNIHYAIYYNRRFYINPFVGLMYRTYHATIFDEWILRQNHNPIPSTNVEDENQIGFQTGVNINVPIYWGIYANTNIRYNLIPWAQYNKQNIYWELGIGYKIERRKEK